MFPFLDRWRYRPYPIRAPAKPPLLACPLATFGLRRSHLVGTLFHRNPCPQKQCLGCPSREPLSDKFLIYEDRFESEGPVIYEQWQNPQDTRSENPGACFFTKKKEPTAAATQTQGDPETYAICAMLLLFGKICRYLPLLPPFAATLPLYCRYIAAILVLYWRYIDAKLRYIAAILLLYCRYLPLFASRIDQGRLPWSAT